MNNSAETPPSAPDEKPVNPTLTDRFDFILGITDDAQRLRTIIDASRKMEDARNALPRSGSRGSEQED